jgi:pilus assembly protein CpaF
MLQAMNTGHEGSMTTIHANTARDAISRLEQMVGMAGMPMSQSSIRATIASAIRLVLQVERMSDGHRRVVSISEMTGMEGDVVQMQDVFIFKKLGLTEDKHIIGEFRATGLRPRCIEPLSAIGLTMAPQCFDPSRTFRVGAAIT